MLVRIATYACANIVMRCLHNHWFLPIIVFERVNFDISLLDAWCKIIKTKGMKTILAMDMGGWMDVWEI